MRDLCGPMRTYADLCGPMQAYLARKALDSRERYTFQNACQGVARALRGAAAPPAATAVTHSASMRPAIADSQATEEQLRAGECVRAARPDGRERGHREERPGATDFLRALRGAAAPSAAQAGAPACVCRALHARQRWLYSRCGTPPRLRALRRNGASHARTPQQRDVRQALQAGGATASARSGDISSAAQ